MTEEWYSSDQASPMGSAITYIDGRKKKRFVASKRFTHGETVPPCRTCELAIPYLLCIDDPNCNHQ